MKINEAYEVRRMTHSHAHTHTHTLFYRPFFTSAFRFAIQIDLLIHSWKSICFLKKKNRPFDSNVMFLFKSAVCASCPASVHPHCGYIVFGLMTSLRQHHYLQVGLLQRHPVWCASCNLQCRTTWPGSPDSVEVAQMPVHSSCLHGLPVRQ